MTANLKQQVKIVTDSTSDIPLDLAARLGIAIVPLSVTVGDKTYRDAYEITPKEFYEKLPGLKTLPTTSQPPIPLFEQAYSEALRDGLNVISIHISSKLSGTFNSASVAAQNFPTGRIKVIDSKLVTAALGLIVIKAAEMAQEGKDMETIEREVYDMIDRTYIFATADTLEYLHKGGRIGGLRSLFGTILAVKPIFQVKNGELVPYQNVRTKRKALERIAELTKEMGPIEKLAIAHADSPGEAGELANMVAAAYPLKDIYESYIGPVVGAHAGPKTMGVCFVKAKS